MKKIITKEQFLKIFENPNYRQRLDKIILNFFGLDANIPLSSYNNSKNVILLEFILFINTEYVLKIVVEDKEKIFKRSRSFYINLSFREVLRHHQLLMPCYWEIYCEYSLKHLKKEPKILLIAALLSCRDMKEIREILKMLECFNKEEINNIINILISK